MDISVIICTRNRCQKLKNALNSLEKLIVPKNVEWEIIIVDNGSTDSTSEMCQYFKKRNIERYRYILETRKGKCFALNTSIQVSKGKILAFTDDDCIVDKYWLQEIIKEYREDHELAVLGGRVELYNKRDKPIATVTIKKSINFTTPEMLYPDPMIIGANLAAKKEIFSRVGKFDEKLGPGTKGGSAEDVDFIYRAFKRGFKVTYFPNIKVYHNHGRSTDEEIKPLIYKYYVGRGAFYFKNILKGDIKVSKMAYKDIYFSFKQLCKLRGIRGELVFLKAIFIGALTRLSLKKID